MKPRVLIVDDEPDMLELVEHQLSSQGFEVLRATNGLQALRTARCEAPDVIVLDLLLPDLNGLCVCDILCSQPSTRDIPVVILSALDGRVTRARKPVVQVARWLKKGCDIHLLGDCVRDALGEHRERIKRRLASEDCQPNTTV